MAYARYVSGLIHLNKNVMCQKAAVLTYLKREWNIRDAELPKARNEIDSTCIRVNFQNQRMDYAVS